MSLELIGKRLLETQAEQRSIRMELGLVRSALTGLEGRLIDALADRIGRWPSPGITPCWAVVRWQDGPLLYQRISPVFFDRAEATDECRLHGQQHAFGEQP